MPQSQDSGRAEFGRWEAEQDFGPPWYRVSTACLIPLATTPGQDALKSRLMTSPLGRGKSVQGCSADVESAL